MQCSLRKNDCVQVGSVVISVLEVMHDSVRLGIADPGFSPTYREEVLYLSSMNDDSDADDQFDEQFEPLTSETLSPFAIHVL